MVTAEELLKGTDEMRATLWLRWYGCWDGTVLKAEEGWKACAGHALAASMAAIAVAVALADEALLVFFAMALRCTSVSSLYRSCRCRFYEQVIWLGSLALLGFVYPREWMSKL